MQFGAATPDLKGDLADRFAVDASDARGCPNAEALGKSGNNFNLFRGEGCS